MMNELARLKPALVRELEVFLARATAEDSLVSNWTQDLMARLLDYATRGKMIRGALVSTGARIFTHEPGLLDDRMTTVCLRLGAAMELIQSLLLIHDDIMDQDDLRRGKPSVHTQYIHLVQGRKAGDPQRLGESLGICAGDVSGFLAFEILAALDLEPTLLRELFALTSHELTLVGLAQMSDVYNGGIAAEVGFEDIIQLYRYKTGRYTFSLPLMSGALCAGADQKCRQLLGDLGELFGIIFQIKDDDLGLFGSSERTGKPLGSDIRDDKKTLHRFFLFERADVSERKVFREIFGHRNASEKDVQLVLNRMEGLGVREHIDTELERYAEQARHLIAKLDQTTRWGRDTLEGLLAYNLERET